MDRFSAWDLERPCSEEYGDIEHTPNRRTRMALDAKTEAERQLFDENDHDARQRKKQKEVRHDCIVAKVNCTGINNGSRCPRCEQKDLECIWEVSAPKVYSGWKTAD